MMQINANHVLYSAKTILPQMEERYTKLKQKSAVLITSSSAYKYPGIAGTVYCATKIFANFVAEGLFVEFADKIDFISYCPGEVATKLINKKDAAPGGGTISCEYAADVAFRDIGINPVSEGAFMHEFLLWMIGLFPLRWL